MTITVTTQLDRELHERLVQHASARRCSMSQVIKDQLVRLLIGSPSPLPPASTALTELRRRTAPVITVAEAKRRAAKGGRQ